MLATPAEPAGSTFKDRLTHPAYPTHEVGGMVFAYLGPREKMPLFPNYEWTNVPSDHCYVVKSLLECNYLQGLEGECDSSHLSFLHRNLAAGEHVLYKADTSPSYETEDADFGVRLVALRHLDENKTYVRVSSFLMPLSCVVPVRGAEDGYDVHFYTPLDDTHAWRFDFTFKRSRAIAPGDRERDGFIDEQYHKRQNKGNHYRIDREKQRRENFTGLGPIFPVHDGMATETQGSRYDRSAEHLGTSDKGVISVRRFMLDAIKAYQRGEEPPHVVTDPSRNDFRHLDSLTGVIDGDDWRATYPHLRCAPGEAALVR